MDEETLTIEFTTKTLGFSNGDIVMCPIDEAARLIRKGVARRLVGKELKKALSRPPSDKMMRIAANK